MKGKWTISVFNTAGREVSKMKRRAFAVLTIATLIAALVIVAFPEAAAASGIVVGRKIIQNQEPNQPEGQDECENQGPPEDEGSLNCPSEQPNNYPPEEECTPPETTNTPQDTPNDTPSEEELPCTAGNSSLYVWLGLVGLLIGAVGVTRRKVIQREEV